MVWVSVDAGTSLGKTVAFDDDGAEMALSRREVPIERPQPGFSEQDPVAVWDASTASPTSRTVSAGRRRARSRRAAARVADRKATPMRLQREREQIVEFSQRMTPDDLTVGTSGNVSIRSGDLVVVTPSGVEYEDLTPELICVIDPDGGMVEGELRPTSEVPMHTSVYRETDWQAVVHTHPSHATALSLLVDELPAVHYMIALLGGPVRVAPYGTYGTPELAKNALRGLQDRSAVLLANHGASTVGETLDKAYTRSVYLEWICKLYYQARLLGDPALLSEEEIAHVADKLQTYGQAPPSDNG